jgi:hypothetical protein
MSATAAAPATFEPALRDTPKVVALFDTSYTVRSKDFPMPTFNERSPSSVPEFQRKHQTPWLIHGVGSANEKIDPALSFDFSALHAKISSRGMTMMQCSASAGDGPGDAIHLCCENVRI